MDEMPDIINIMGGMKRLNKLKSNLAAKKVSHLHDAVNSLNTLNNTSNLSEHTEQVLNQKNYGFFNKLYSFIIELGNEFWLSIIAAVVIFIIKQVLYDEDDKDVDISNVTDVVKGNATYETDLQKQRKLLYYIKDKFLWAEFTSSTANGIFAVLFNSWLVHTLAVRGINFDLILIIITISVAWYSGFLYMIFSFIESWITDDTSKTA